MKRYIIFVMLFIIVWACNNNRYSANKKLIDSSAAGHLQFETTTDKLLLNKGTKWKSDSSTNNNVKGLLVIIESFNSGADKSLLAYRNTADGLQNGLDKMIKECKMQGPDHDALHKWLEPLIEQLAKFKKASTEAETAQSLEAIHAQVNIYAKYFE